MTTEQLVGLLRETSDRTLLHQVMGLDEAREAYKIGLNRSQAGRARSGQHRFGWNPTPEEQRRVDGASAVAECLVAKITGRRWLSCGLTPDPADAGDVEGGLSVRWTTRLMGSLIVHEDESDDLIGVLVVGEVPDLWVAGYLPVIEARSHSEWWREDVRHPAFFVPQSALRHISELRA